VVHQAGHLAEQLTEQPVRTETLGPTVTLVQLDLLQGHRVVHQAEHRVEHLMVLLDQAETQARVVTPVPMAIMDSSKSWKKFSKSDFDKIGRHPSGCLSFN
jgi:hypothetical protein